MRGTSAPAPDPSRYWGLTPIFPPPGGGVVALPRLHPSRAGGRVLLLPEGRARLQVIHDELAGGEGLAAMGARYTHHHDAIARHQRADAVDDQHFLQVPALAGLVADFLERLLGHAGIVLERHAAD